jgi:hypothetical protein
VDFIRVYLVVLPIIGSFLTGLAPLRETLVEFDEIDAAEEFEKTWTSNVIEDIHSAFLTLQQPRSLHERKVLGQRGDIASREGGEIVHAFFTPREHLHHEKARGMCHRFDYRGPVVCGVFG